MELCVDSGEQEELMAGRYLWSRLLSTGLGSGRESFFAVVMGLTKFQKVL